MYSLVGTKLDLFCLIKKCKRLKMFSNFGPISLCNILYKIVRYGVVNRLGKNGS